MATETNRSGALRTGFLSILSPPQVPLTVTVTQDTVRSIGLTELDGEIDLAIYPNPARDQVIIEGVGMDQLDLDQLLLFNSMGKQVQVNFVRRDPRTVEVNLSSQAAGIYYLNYRSDDKGLSRKLILLR